MVCNDSGCIDSELEFKKFKNLNRFKNLLNSPINTLKVNLKLRKNECFTWFTQNVQ